VTALNHAVFSTSVVKCSSSYTMIRHMFCIFHQDSVSEPEQFTAELQKVLKSSPQPYLVPFLKVWDTKLMYSHKLMVVVATNFLFMPPPAK